MALGSCQIGTLYGEGCKLVPKPNLFIIGAPKCGTTSMHNWLSGHPQIYMSTLKEPCFFATDFSDRYVKTLREYERLFEKATAKHSIIGESSVWNLMSEVAVKKIMDYQKDARFIVCLRNPVEMAISLHNQMVFNGYESRTSFKDAWAVQAERQAGREIPKQCLEPKEVTYSDACMLGRQLQRLYEVVSQRQVLTVLLDDLKTSPQEGYARVLDFLGVPNDGREYFPAENRHKARAMPRLHRVASTMAAVKHRMGIRRGFGVLNTLAKVNKREQGYKPVDANTRLSVLSFFEDDIRLLERILGRSLEAWF